MSNKIIITIATPGAWPKKEQSPHVPLTPAEIAEDVYKCYKAGASIAHLHMRDDDGNGTLSKDNFEEPVALIKERCDIILNLTTSGDLNATDETRQEHLKLIRPDMASYDCGSMNWMHSSLFINHPKFLEELGMTMQEYNVKPEIEIFDAGMIYNSLYYLKKGVLKAPVHYQFVLGAAGGMAATWSAFGIGKGHVPIMLAAIALGGHIRVGLEDNLYYGPGVLATNEQLVTRASNLIKESGNEVASLDDVRQILGLVK